MKIEIEQRELKNALGVLGRVMPTKNTMPILECVHFDVRNSAVLLTACDSDMCRLEIECSATADEEGCFCVKADMMARALAQISDQMLTLEIVRQGDAVEVLHVEHKDGGFSMPTEDASAYPELKDDTYEGKMILPRGEVLSRTMWAASGEELRLQMTAVCITPSGEHTDIVASDGHVLVRNRLLGETVSHTILIPRKTAGLIAALATEGATMEWNNTRVFARLGRAKLWAQLIEGAYPQYNKVIPTEHKMKVIVPRAAMVAATKQVLPFGSEQSRASTLIEMTFRPGELVITAEDSAFQRKASSRVAIDYDGEEFCIGANGQRTVEVLNNMPGERVVILLINESRPMIFTPEQQTEDAEVLMLQMPMLLNS